MITVNVPGSLMICGEHSVVYGYQAIACAVAQSITVELKPRADNRVSIHSALAKYEADLTNLKAEPALRFVLAAVAQHLPSQGFNLTIKSEINPTLGFGSSAAVTVATIAALLEFNAQPVDLLTLHHKAHQVILKVQTRGSGADLAASIYGGMVAYTPPLDTQITSLPLPDKPLSIRYAGYKTPTAEVLAKIATLAEKNPHFYQTCYQQMGTVTQSVIAKAQQQDWSAFYSGLHDYQYLMEKLGVCDEVQSSHITQARSLCEAVKISGSGLGDCIIAFSEKAPPLHQPVEISKIGVKINIKS